VLGIRDRDLPLWVNFKWVTEVGRESYLDRLGGLELEDPSKESYSSRYLDEREILKEADE